MATTTNNSLAKFLAPLAKLNKAALQKKYREVLGRPTKSDNLQHLRAAIAKCLYERETPAPTKAAPTTKPAAPSKPTVTRDPRLPSLGTVLEREHGKVVHKVKVLDDAFEYRGQRHRSLSAIAKQITGTNWNGYAFFGLNKAESR